MKSRPFPLESIHSKKYAMSHTILVIGATGNVGRPLVELLAEQGSSVKAATRHPETYTAAPGVEAVAFDYEKPETWSAALDGIGRLFLLAQGAGNEPDQAMIPFLDQAQTAGVGSVVLMTAMGMDTAAMEARGLRKVERHLMASGLAYTILRPTWFMQNFTGYMGEMIQQQGGLYMPTADAKSSFIDTRDIAAVAAAALTEDGHAGKAYTLTGPEALSYAEALAVLSDAAGRVIPYVAITEDDTRKALAGEGWPPVDIDMMLFLYNGVRQGWYAAVSPDVSAVLGRPPIALRQFAEENAEAWSATADERG